MRRLLRTAAVLAFQALVVRPVILWFVGVRYRRRSLVPNGPCLVVANHNSHLDAAVLLTLFPLRRVARVHPVAAADYFGKTWLRRAMAMLFMNGIPIERAARAGAEALQPMIRALEDGESLIFFPEGSRGEAGVVAPFRSGVGRLVQAIPGLLVVPVFLTGPERIWPRGQKIPVPLGIDASVGKPRTYPREIEARAIAEQVRDDVLALAPPPAPVPGPRPEPPVRAAVCGIDPGSRGALAAELVRVLGKSERTVGIADPALEAGLDRLPRLAVPNGRAVPRVQVRGDGRARADGRVPRGWTNGAVRRRVRQPARGPPGLGRGGLLPRDVRRARPPPRGALPLGRAADPGVEMVDLNVLDLARLRVPRVLLLVSTPPSDVMERLRATGTPLEPYENETFLGKLQEAYLAVAAILKRRGVEVFEIESPDLSPETDAVRAAEACLRVAEGTGAAEAAPQT
jgi:1-acyl-sn-glycerol-3-phosphate acyltransferase